MSTRLRALIVLGACAMLVTAAATVGILYALALVLSFNTTWATSDTPGWLAVLQSVAIANFALLAYYGPDLRLFGAVMAVDNFCIAFAGVALVTYMSSLTSLG